MKKRQIYHVTPSPGGGWNIKKEGGQRSSGHFDTKDQAVDRGRDLISRMAIFRLSIPMAKILTRPKGKLG
jgi:hypothetical protein